MTALPLPDLASRSLGDIAAALPGATALFRRHKLDFCCGGRSSLAEATTGAGLSLDALVEELRKLEPTDAAPPNESDALIAYILDRFHAVHRRELPELIVLAKRVEQVHTDHSQVPSGLSALLEQVAANMESHLQKEERILFPMMLSGGHPMIAQPIGVMRGEHDSHGDTLRKLEVLTHDFEAPSDACDGWRALCAGLRKFTDDLMMHIHLENNVLFPRFGA